MPEDEDRAAHTERREQAQRVFEHWPAAQLVQNFDPLRAHARTEARCQDDGIERCDRRRGASVCKDGHGRTIPEKLRSRRARGVAATTEPAAPWIRSS